MDTVLEFLVGILFLWLYALIVIGPFQVFAALIRALTVKDWNSNFGKRLITYFKLLIGYWIAAAIAYYINLTLDSEWIIYLFVPILCTALAIYYWRAIYLLYKEKRALPKENN